MKKRLMVVDDEPALTRMVKLNLEQTGRYEVRTENVGKSALDAAREFRPELVLLDVLMPGMLGSEIAARMQEDPELRSIKIVFLTAVVTKQEELKLEGRIGGYTLVAKPVGAEELCRVVAEELGQ